MHKYGHLFGLFFIIAAILAVAATKVDLNQKKEEYPYYKIVNTYLDTHLITVENEYVSQHIQREGIWKAGVTKCVLENTKPSDVVVEVGSNIGYYTTIIATILKRGDGELISYEANEEVYRLAKASLILNNLDSKVQLKNLAISDKDGEIQFSYYGINPETPTNLGGSHITVQSDFKQKNLKQRMVKCVSLDGDLADIPSIDLLRMDIEGSECLVIKGAKKLLQRSPNLKIIMEWSPNTLQRYCNIDEFIKEIREHGFEIYHIDDKYFYTGKMQKLSDEQLKKIEFADILLKRDMQ